MKLLELNGDTRQLIVKASLMVAFFWLVAIILKIMGLGGTASTPWLVVIGYPVIVAVSILAVFFAIYGGISLVIWFFERFTKNGDK